MSGSLNNQPGEIIQQLLADFSMGTLPVVDGVAVNGLWPIYYNHMPDSPHSALCVNDSDGSTHGRLHPTGDISEHYGIQVESRAAIQREARQKLQQIDRAFATLVLRTAVVVGTSSYLVQAITREGSLHFVGLDEVSRRRIYTANYLVALSLLSAESFGTGS